MYSAKQKEVINNIYFYYKLLCSRTESFINEHPEAVEILTSYFEATGFRPMKPVQQTSIITGVFERSIRRFDEQQTFSRLSGAPKAFNWEEVYGTTRLVSRIHQVYCIV